MRISSKCRYGVAAMISIALSDADCVTIISISEKLGISKIYLEQVFSLLKRAGLVTSIKGAQGGYQLAMPADKITAGDIMRASEIGLFESAERSVSEQAAEIDRALEIGLWTPLDDAVSQALSSITLQDLADEVIRQRHGEDTMFYI